MERFYPDRGRRPGDRSSRRRGSPAFGRAAALLRPIGPSACARPTSCSMVTQPLGLWWGWGCSFGMLEMEDLLIP
jgi:hypothetical protein